MQHSLRTLENMQHYLKNFKALVPLRQFFMQDKHLAPVAPDVFAQASMFMYGVMRVPKQQLNQK